MDMKALRNKPAARGVNVDYDQVMKAGISGRETYTSQLSPTRNLRDAVPASPKTEPR